MIHGQTKSTSYLTNVMPINADVTNVTEYFLSKSVVPINIFCQNMWCQ